MTCIVGFVESKDNRRTVWMGGDSAAVSGWDMRATPLPKVFSVGRLLVGITGSPRMGQILQHHLEWDSLPEDGCSVMNYMVTKFVPQIRKLFSEHGFAKKDNNVESVWGSIMVGFNGRLYVVHDDYQVETHGRDDPYMAIGCGANFALAAIDGLRHTHLKLGQPDPATPEWYIERALEIAEKYSAGVRRPFHITSTNHPW